MPKITNERIIIESDLYQNTLDKRGLKKITINAFSGFDPSFNPENHPYTLHIWTKKDKLIKLANLYYRNYRYWAVIGFFNNKPIDHLYELGEEIKIPSNPANIESIMESYND